MNSYKRILVLLVSFLTKELTFPQWPQTHALSTIIATLLFLLLLLNIKSNVKIQLSQGSISHNVLWIAIHNVFPIICTFSAQVSNVHGKAKIQYMMEASCLLRLLLSGLFEIVIWYATWSIWISSSCTSCLPCNFAFVPYNVRLIVRLLVRLVGLVPHLLFLVQLASFAETC